MYDAFGQRIVSTLYTQSNQYRVILQAETNGSVTYPTGSERDLSAVRHRHHGQVPLATIVHLSTRAVAVAGGTSGPVPLRIGVVQPGAGRLAGPGGDAKIDAAEHDVGLPDSFTTSSFQGSLAAFQASLSNELLLIVAAMVAVYVMLGVLYESFIHPMTILSTLPSAGVGALIALDATGHDLDIIAIIGIILLIGIVKKNAIMMIDFALAAERQEGKPRARRSTRPACCASAPS